MMEVPSNNRHATAQTDQYNTRAFLHVFNRPILPSYNIFPYKRKMGPRPILNGQQLRPSEVKSLRNEIDNEIL